MAKDLKVGIIGAGAAGLFAACQFTQLSGEKPVTVTLIEKNHIPGRKLTLTGHGRCNITNRKEASELKKGYHEAANFIYPALREFGPDDMIEFVEDCLELKTKEEENNRIFPVIEDAFKVRALLMSHIALDVDLVLNEKVTSISKTDCFEVVTELKTYRFDCVILCCGGSSFSKTGSTGDSYKFAASLGHHIEPLRGALVPVDADSASVPLCRDLSGVSVTAGVSLYCDDKKTASLAGELLFADFGLTGPAVMEIAREIPADLTGRKAWLELDLVPSMNEEEFDREFQRLIGEHPDTKITTLLSRYVPASVAEAVAAKAGVSGLYAQGFTKENRKKLLREAKHLKIGIANPPEIEKAYVTRGGVSLSEIDRKTMESKIVPGLYIIGEALDVDGISGGYNLQACMSEAYLAAKDILAKVETF